MLSAEAIIERLRLEPLQEEGGWYRQTWCSTARSHSPDDGPPDPAGDRPAGTAIYFLITPDQFSALHRLTGDEIWCHHLGDPLRMLMLHPDGRGETVLIGPDLTANQRPQHLCPGRVWQGTRIAPGPHRFGYALATCSMAPGFAWTDFELADRASLVREYPDFRHAITELTRG
jgi:predicted cupin superfamily sugar epimerase